MSMNKNVYRSAVNQVKFDEQMDKKIMDYLAKKSGERISMKQSKCKMKVAITVAACAVCMISGTTYAAVKYFKNIAHMDYGLVAKDDINGIEISTGVDEESVFPDTSKIRSEMGGSTSGFVLRSEERGSDGVKWDTKKTWKDVTPTYISEDGIKWERDEAAGAAMMTQYTYTQYEMATQDAGMPNVMKTLLDITSMCEAATYEAYTIEESEDIIRKRVVGVFAYEEGKLEVDLSQDLGALEDGNHGTVVITGVNKATNQRTYQTQKGMTYQLSDNINDGITKTTTLVSSGDYSLIIQFENLTDQAIHTLLEEIDLSAFELEF